MPKGVVKTPADEKRWAKAKERAREEYGLSEDDERFWRLVNGIYQTMRKARAESSRDLFFPIAKSWGDAGTPPIANAPHHAQRADADLLREAADTTSDAHMDLYTLYQRVCGDKARASLRVTTLRTDRDGALYRLDDGVRILRVYQPRNGPARLVKALTAYASAPYVVWQALRRAGYDPVVTDHAAVVDGCTVRAEGQMVSVEGKRAGRVLQAILEHMDGMQASDDWVGGHQEFAGARFSPGQPW